jgi:hypothetical protein
MSVTTIKKNDIKVDRKQISIFFIISLVDLMDTQTSSEIRECQQVGHQPSLQNGLKRRTLAFG